MAVMTVLGPIDGEQLGVTLMHEHLLIDVSYKWQQPTEVTLRALAEQPITLANLGYLRRNIGAVRANFRLDDVDTAAAEALAFKRDGGDTIVDVSPVGIGRDPRALRAVAGHLDVRIDVEYADSVAARGAYAEFDTFGIEAYLDSSLSEYPRDTERVAALVELVQRGYVERLLVSHDVCTKMQLVAYGGWGYGHLSRNIEPRLRKAGLSDAQIATIRVANPRRLLDVC